MKSEMFLNPTLEFLAVLLSLLYMLGPAQADEVWPFSPRNPHGFELKLPPEWTPVNSNLLAVIRTIGRSHDSRIPNPEGIYTYQRASDRDEFNPPYIMVAIKNVGKIPESFARKLSIPGRAQEEIVAAFRGPMKDLLPDGYRLIGATFDTNLYAMRLELEFQSELGLLRSSVVNFFTEKGTVEVTALTRPSDYATWALTFEGIIASVRFAEWLQYQRRPVVNLSSGVTDWLYPLGGIAIIAIGGFLCTRFLRNRDSAADY